ncbi:MAG TPA: hypothetical protein ENN65_08135, partial [Candidatus Hydrogenedentes bacterium]|nr:hypothetical protein [Candidatus Hydrogenedentota bacterium]
MLWASDAVYVQKDSWSETLLATRANYQQWQSARHAAGELALDAWYATNPMKSSFDDALFPEQGVDLDSRDENNRRQWRKRTAWIDGVAHNLPGEDHAATYLFRAITAASDTVITVGLGSDDGVALWLNGELLLSRDVPRVAAPNQDMVKLPLRAGKNELLMKIYNRTGGHGFYFAVADDPAFPIWQMIAHAYPEETTMATRDIAGGAPQTLLSDPDGLRQVPDMIERALRGVEPYDAALRAELAVLKDGNAPYDDARWLDLYVKAGKARESAAALRLLNPEALRRSIEHLITAYGGAYPKGKEYLSRLDAIEAAMPALAEKMGRQPDAAAEIGGIAAFAREALLANPLLDFEQILLVKRGEGQLGLPQNWQGNCSLPRRGYDNEIALLDMNNPDGELKTVFRPERDVFVGDVDLHFDAEKMLFSMPAVRDRWQIWEVGMDGSGLRQVTPGEEPDVDNYDACYLPDDRIIFGSTRIFQGIPCVGGADTVANLFRMDNDGGNARQLCFDQDHNWCPTVMNDGRVLFTRWEYSDTPHYFSRLLFSMNPDGTNQ